MVRSEFMLAALGAYLLASAGPSAGQTLEAPVASRDFGRFSLGLTGGGACLHGRVEAVHIRLELALLHLVEKRQCSLPLPSLLTT